ncbi:FIG018329: 1-acyl-sn-glycerol-3-phosphate acyltransferase [hydrothermal vent metagenome]|uniref:FIG018329: 1-acyl-sn-glycerol-3-phosphate acyltransferase n=1 Tax=hydrothermal vent metagenome TaxID=652676 RepID=A0A3B1AQZ4_9ZZZZ
MTGIGSLVFNKFFYVWRLIATGWCFLTFSVGGFLLAVFVFPVINLIAVFIPNEQLKHHRAQAVIHYSFKFFLWQMILLGIMRMNIVGMEKLNNNKAKLILANHPTLVDVVLLISLIKHTNCVVKRSLFKDPFLKGVVTAAGYINNDGSDAIIDECSRALKAGDNLVIFPEGTRSVPGKEMKFQRGAAHIATRSGTDVVPVTITCDPPTLTKAQKWYHIPSRPFCLTAEVGDPLDISDIVMSDEPATLTSRRLTKYLHDYFTRRLEQFGIIRARA